MEFPDGSLVVMVMHRCAVCDLIHQSGAASGGIALEEWKELSRVMLDSDSWYVGPAVSH
jgi:hypothetical protein